MEKEKIKIAAEKIKAGGIVAFPTETVYGLGADAGNDAAVKRIFKAKGRDDKKPLSVLVASVKDIAPLADMTADEKKMAKAFWPGPLTLVMQKKKDAPLSKYVYRNETTIGIRIPQNKTALKLLKTAGVPLAAPSANTSNKPPHRTADGVKKDLGGKIDYILDGETSAIGTSSTVAKVENGKVTILRQGTVTKEDIEKIIRR